jgi:hypothetical protein
MLALKRGVLSTPPELAVCQVRSHVVLVQGHSDPGRIGKLDTAIIDEGTVDECEVDKSGEDDVELFES